MPLLERPLTPRTRHCTEDLGGFAFELELEDHDTSSTSSDCTLHSAWTESEARAAYQRPVWLCYEESDDLALELDVQVKATRTQSAEAYGSHDQPLARGVGHSPACVTHFFWSPAGQSKCPTSESLSKLAGPYM